MTLPVSPRYCHELSLGFSQAFSLFTRTERDMFELEYDTESFLTCQSIADVWAWNQNQISRLIWEFMF